MLKKVNEVVAGAPRNIISRKAKVPKIYVPLRLNQAVACCADAAPKPVRWLLGCGAGDLYRAYRKRVAKMLQVGNLVLTPFIGTRYLCGQ
jgi:hypothetical protein